MKLGITGTQDGMTRVQQDICCVLASQLSKDEPVEVHHGDCIGADTEANDAFDIFGNTIVIHPPKNPDKRADCHLIVTHAAVIVLLEKHYLARNIDIVDATDSLLAFPKTMKEERRSGTWATIRYAIAQGKPVDIVFPDGSQSRHNY